MFIRLKTNKYPKCSLLLQKIFAFQELLLEKYLNAISKNLKYVFWNVIIKCKRKPCVWLYLLWQYISLFQSQKIKSKCVTYGTTFKIYNWYIINMSDLRKQYLLTIVCTGYILANFGSTGEKVSNLWCVNHIFAIFVTY